MNEKNYRLVKRVLKLLVVMCIIYSAFNIYWLLQSTGGKFTTTLSYDAAIGMSGSQKDMMRLYDKSRLGMYAGVAFFWIFIIVEYKENPETHFITRLKKRMQKMED